MLGLARRQSCCLAASTLPGSAPGAHSWPCAVQQGSSAQPGLNVPACEMSVTAQHPSEKGRHPSTVLGTGRSNGNAGNAKGKKSGLLRVVKGKVLGRWN